MFQPRLIVFRNPFPSISLPSFLYFCHLPNITSAQKEEIDRGGKPGGKRQKSKYHDCCTERRVWRDPISVWAWFCSYYNFIKATFSHIWQGVGLFCVLFIFMNFSISVIYFRKHSGMCNTMLEVYNCFFITTTSASFSLLKRRFLFATLPKSMFLYSKTTKSQMIDGDYSCPRICTSIKGNYRENTFGQEIRNWKCIGSVWSEMVN